MSERAIVLGSGDLEQVRVVPQLQLNDVVVFRSPGRLSTAEVARVEGALHRLFPNNKCVVLHDGASIEVVRG